jgi:hypothetical protein
MDKQLISEEGTFLWLWRGDLKTETESKLIASHNQVLQTKYHTTRILPTETHSKCRLSQQFDKTID